MQENDREQIGIEKIKEAIKKKESVEVVLRNFRKNGELFYNHLLISPLFDSMGNLLYYLGVQYDLSSRIKAEEEIRKLKESIEKITCELNIKT